jgi:hypothetical protein
MVGAIAPRGRAIMSSFAFNISKGQHAYYASLPAASDALVVIPIEATGVEADATVVDYATVAAILAASTNEQTTIGRKIITAVTATVDNPNDRVNIDTADITWATATGNAISDLLVAYDPDTTGGTDADLIPLSWHDFPITPDGSNITATVNDLIRCT